MQSMTIGLPTLARQFSMAWLSSNATAILIGAKKTSTATKVALAIGFINLISEPHWSAGNKCIKRNAMVDSNRDMYQAKGGYDGSRPTHAVFRCNWPSHYRLFRLHQPRRLALVRIMSGKLAPTIEPGTGVGRAANCFFCARKGNSIQW